MKLENTPQFLMVTPSSFMIHLKLVQVLTEAAGAKRAALRPSGPLSAPVQKSDEFGYLDPNCESDKVCIGLSVPSSSGTAGPINVYNWT